MVRQNIGIGMGVGIGMVVVVVVASDAHVCEQQFLGEHAAGRVDGEGEAGALPRAQLGDDVREEVGRVGAGRVPVLPEVALQVLEVGDFDVASREVLDVGAEVGGRFAVFGGEGVAVWLEGWVVPVGGEDVREGAEGVWDCWGLRRVT
jgi:hypothetical protein